METLYQMLTVALPLLGTGLSWLVANVILTQIKKMKSDYARGVSARFSNAVLAAVLYVNQVFVDDLKEKNKDGKLTKVERAQAKQKAIEAAKSYLGKKGINEVLKVIGIGAFETEVEAQVFALKNSIPKSITRSLATKEGDVVPLGQPSIA